MAETPTTGELQTAKAARERAEKRLCELLARERGLDPRDAEVTYEALRLLDIYEKWFGKGRLSNPVACAAERYALASMRCERLQARYRYAADYDL